MPFLKEILLKNQPKYSETDLQLLQKVFKRKVVSKNTILTKANLVCDSLFVIESGVIRFFFTHKKKEYTWNLATEGMFTTVLSSFISHSPSHDTLQTVCDSVVYEMKYADNQKLINQMPAYAEMYRKLLELALIEQGQRMREQVAATGIERYQKLLNTRPELFQIVPQGILGSYLGMTRQSLSRLQKQVFMEKGRKL